MVIYCYPPQQNPVHQLGFQYFQCLHGTPHSHSIIPTPSCQLHQPFWVKVVRLEFWKYREVLLELQGKSSNLCSCWCSCPSASVTDGNLTTRIPNSKYVATRIWPIPYTFIWCTTWNDDTWWSASVFQIWATSMKYQVRTISFLHNSLSNTRDLVFFYHGLRAHLCPCEDLF